MLLSRTGYASEGLRFDLVTCNDLQVRSYCQGTPAGSTKLLVAGCREIKSEFSELIGEFGLFGGFCAYF